MSTPYFAFHVRHRNDWSTGCGPRPTVCAECGDALPPPPGAGGSTGYGCDSHSMVIDAASYTRLTREAPPTLARGDVLEVSRAYCFECCGRRDADAMRATGRATLYLVREQPAPRGWYLMGRHNSIAYFPASQRAQAEAEARRTGARLEAMPGPEWFATNWPGTLRIPAGIKHAPRAGGFGANRVDAWFEYQGARWHGVNRGDNQILRCRRLKEKRP